MVMEDLVYLFILFLWVRQEKKIYTIMKWIILFNEYVTLLILYLHFSIKNRNDSGDQ